MTEDKVAYLDKAIEVIEERKQKIKEAMEGNPPEPVPPPPKEPSLERAAYFAKWFQQLVPIRTNCFRCGIDSPIVHTVVDTRRGVTLAFGGPIKRGEIDISNDLVLAFEKIGWRFQKNRSYCQTCKKLGSI